MNQESLSEYVFGKAPPNAKDVEEIVLGAILVDSGVLDQVLDLLDVEMFYAEENKMVCEAILSLAKRSSSIDILTVVQEMRALGTIDKAGGPYYVTGLTSRVASTAHIADHIKIVKAQYVRRRMGDLGMKLTREAYEETIPVTELMQAAEKGIFEISNSGTKKAAKPVSEFLYESISALEEAKNVKNGMTGVPCGFTTLDRVTGGWQKTDLIILAARPSQGKTALGLNIAKGAAEMGKPVAFFSLEMSGKQLVNRLMASEAEVNGEHILRGTLQDAQWQYLLRASETISNMPLFIDDTSSLGILEFKSKCRKLKLEHGIQLIVVDYLQLMVGERMRGDSRDREIGTISAGLKAVAKDLDVPVIALSQLSRANEQRGGSKRPMLSDLRESGNIEQDADIVMFIHRPEYYGITEDEDGHSLRGLAEIIFAKHRNGAVGTVDLKFEPQFTKFSDIEEFNPVAAVTVTPSPGNESVPF